MSGLRRSCRTALLLALGASCARCADPSIPIAEPAWGDPVDGYVLALSFDKTTYRPNEPIHVHLACSRLTADWVRVTPGPACDALITVVTADGTPPDRPNGDYECVTVTSRRRATALEQVTRGAVLATDRPLTTDKDCGWGWEYFDPKPGTYTAAALWHVWQPNSGNDLFIRSKPVTFTVAGR